MKSEEVISKKSSFVRMRIFWRREWDSNPRDVAVKRFSRPPRYDRFDIPAYSVLLRGFSRNRLRKAAARYARSGTFVTQSISQIPCVVKDFLPARVLPPLRRFRFPIERMGDFREACAGRVRHTREGSRRRTGVCLRGAERSGFSCRLTRSPCRTFFIF